MIVKHKLSFSYSLRFEFCAMLSITTRGRPIPLHSGQGLPPPIGQRPQQVTEAFKNPQADAVY